MRGRTIPGSQVVDVGARLDGGTVAQLRPLLHEAVDAGDGDLVVDLSELELIDAAGLGVLVGTHRRALRAERRLVLRGVPPRVMRLLAVTRLHRVIRVEPHAAAAA
ncbi:STAS domain-containing protein [Sphaerisporangium sp. TRM90804]|uniref:STAS domain-containing protein n=1 Tax=Sphaerisporangium sp. TRM90804 TaxID=3031113 RepID=UPI00244726EE|nr:STAS domain-containing protein [Sphaerisporangium sp. TRM90804]MDH2429979.1 STAS domain-containing protein [Sphaerisporangium sp. TRM90804]